MQGLGAEVPTAVWAIVAAIVLIDLAVLVDLALHDVRHLPRWAWAVIIVVVTFPVGVGAYFVLGRVPRGEHAEVAVAPASPELTEDPAPAPPAHATPRPRPVPAPDRPPALVTRGLTKTYGETVALDAVDLVVPAGSIYGLVGPNGAGKTTLLSLLAGLRRPTRGHVDLSVPRQSVGVLVDTPQFEPWLTARDVVDLARHLTAPGLPRERTIEALGHVGLADAVDRRVGGFSRGMLQRLGLAACLVGDPEVLILDEPSSALDPAGRREVLDLIGDLGQRGTVVLSTHILAEAQQVCDTVGVIDRGHLRFQGPLDDLLARTRSAFSLQVTPPAGPLVAALRAQPWAVEVTESAPGRLRLTVSDAAQAQRAIPGLLTEHDAPLAAFNPATDLETAFLELTT